jgi:hypothetical protein
MHGCIARAHACSMRPAGRTTNDVLFGPGSKITNKDATLFKAMKPPAEGVCPFGPTTTTTTTTTSTTTTTMASPSGAFLDDAALGAG